MKPNYTIGVAVTSNENTCIRAMLSSLEKDLISTSTKNVETILCLNNYDTETERIMDNINFSCLGIRKTYSEKGLIPAQKKMIKESNSNSDFILFYDSDVLVGKKSTKAMFEFMDKNKKVHAVSGKQKAKSINSFWYGVYNILGLNPQIMTPRKYLTGKIFAVRKEDYFVPDFLVSDDIFLSRYLIDKFGEESIATIDRAVIEYVGPITIKDYYEKRRRLIIETEKIDESFPDLRKYRSLFRKSMIKEEVDKMSPKEKLQLRLHDYIKRGVRFMAEHSSKENVWIPLKSTKNIETEK